MLSKAVQAFNDRVAADPALQTKLRAITSPLAFLDCLEGWDRSNNAADLACN